MIPDKQIILFFIFYLISQLIFDRYIYKKINELEDFLNKKGDNLSKVSRSVPGVGLEPTRTLRSTGF